MQNPYQPMPTYIARTTVETDDQSLHGCVIVIERLNTLLELGGPVLIALLV